MPVSKQGRTCSRRSWSRYRALRDKPDDWLRAWRFDDATRSLVPALCLHYSERDAVDDAAALT